MKGTNPGIQAHDSRRKRVKRGYQLLMGVSRPHFPTRPGLISGDFLCPRLEGSVLKCRHWGGCIPGELDLAEAMGESELLRQPGLALDKLIGSKHPAGHTKNTLLVPELEANLEY